MNTLKSILCLIFLALSLQAFSHAGGHHHSPKDYKIWHFKDGSSLKGVFSMSKEGYVYLETEAHEVIPVDIKSLTDADAASIQEKIEEVRRINAPLQHAYASEENLVPTPHATHPETDENTSILVIYWIMGISSALVFLLVLFRKILTKASVSTLEMLIIVTSGTLAVFSLESCKKKGCTDPTASNYSASAEKDDGSCTYDPGSGGSGSFTYSATPNPNNISDMAAAFAPYSAHVSTSNNGTTFFVEADAIANHQMMKGITAWIDQFPVYQKMNGANAWQLPIAPSYSSAGYSIEEHFRKYAIGVAANGIAIFNPLNASGLISADIGELDEYGGHSGTGDDYHYHTAPVHLDNGSSPTIVAYALDGFPVYGALEPDGTPMQALDPVYHGHEINGSFHYHATSSYPYMVKTIRGTVGVDNLALAPDDHIVPQPSTTNFRGNPYPLTGGASSTLIDSCIANGAGNGYTLHYTVDGQSKKVEFHWVAGPTDTIYFNFYNQMGAIEHSEVWMR